MALAAFTAVSECQAQGLSFKASLNAHRIGIRQTVSLELSVQTQDADTNEPSWSAQDFEVVQNLQSTSVSSVFDGSQGFGGRPTTTRTIVFTKVLRPKKLGVLLISHLEVVLQGQRLEAPDLNVTVVEESQRVAQPRGRGIMSPFGSPLRGLFPGFPSLLDPGEMEEDEESPPGEPGAAPPPSPNPPGLSTPPGVPRLNESPKAPIFVRAEVSKSTVYRGEQIVINYYLYRQVKIFNLQVEKFPMLNGFLREDLDVPVMGSRLTNESVLLQGVPYERSLLARYAAYPLKEGTLAIDPIALKYAYTGDPLGGGLDQDDPFFGFFHQAAPRIGSAQSDKTLIRVLPLPAGRSAQDGGGVGQFALEVSVDKPRVKVNESFTLQVLMGGRGNFATLAEPKIAWPPGVEVYDAKSRIKKNRTGSGEKAFEYVVIPRRPGPLTIPEITLHYFDPEQGRYTSQTAPSRQIEVEPGSGALPAPAQSDQPALSLPPPNASGGAPPLSDEGLLRPLKGPLTQRDRPSPWPPIWRFLYWACAGVFSVLVGSIVWELIRLGRGRIQTHPGGQTRRREKELEAAAERMRQDPQAARDGWRWLAQLDDHLLQACGKAVGVDPKSLPRAELGELFLVRGLDPTLWSEIRSALEWTDQARFAPQGEALSEILRQEFPVRVDAVFGLCRRLTQASRRGKATK